MHLPVNVKCGTNVGYPIDASDGESPLAPLGTDERGIPDDRPRRDGVSQCRVHGGALSVEYRIIHPQLKSACSSPFSDRTIHHSPPTAM